MEHLGTRPLETERLLLRGARVSDAEEVYGGYRNQEAFLYYADKQAATLEEIRQDLRCIEKQYGDSGYYNWVITHKKSGRIIGAINLRTISANDAAECNYAIDSRYAGLGYMTEALGCVLSFGLDEVGFHRMQGGCCVENAASRRVMEKCGLRFEGTLRDFIKLKDGYHDMHMFGMTRDAR